MTKTAGLIVAAGMSTRMRQFKPLMEIGQATVISRLVATFEQSGVDPIVIVTGHEAKRLEDHLKKTDVICLRNEDYRTTEMIDSVKIGLSWLSGQCDRVLFSPADVPLFTKSTVDQLMTDEHPIVIPAYKGQEGHPLLLAASLIPAILADGGEGGLRGIIGRLDVPPHVIDTHDRGTQLDADTPDDFALLLDHHDRQLLRPQVRITLAKSKPFFGQTSWRLLSLIGTTGAVAEACARMHISYSKGWQLIRTMEEELGTLLIDRRQGGKTGGSSSLTPEGETLVSRYEALSTRARLAVEQLFDEIFEATDD